MEALSALSKSPWRHAAIIDWLNDRGDRRERGVARCTGTTAARRARRLRRAPQCSCSLVPEHLMVYIRSFAATLA